ncbi:nitroreductase family protein [Thermodesulfobacteriota bacterium]
MIEELAKRTRSIRRFKEDRIEKETLLYFVNIARFAASGANLQPLKYIISFEKKMNDTIFPFLKWAGYLRDWKGPEKGERPSAYIIVMGDKSISGSFGCDHGIATQNILLAASEIGLGCCIIGAVDRKGLSDILKIPEHYELLHVIAIGKPGEDIVVETMNRKDSVEYWRDEDGVHHVPKRALEDIIIKV